MKNGRKAINAETSRIVTVPTYFIFQCCMPFVCNDFGMALKKAREISSLPYNRGEEILIFNTMIGEFTSKYVDGKIVK